jgi:hypothetical protein
VEVAPFVALAVLALVTAAGNLLFPNRAKRIERALAAAPPGLVETAHGTVRLTGHVRRIGELLLAPLTGRPCVAHEIFVDERGHPGSQGMSNWRRRVEIRQASPFMVADESGEARVDTSGPFHIAVVHDRSGTTPWLGRYPGKHRELSLFLEAAGVVATGWLGRWKVFHYSEGVIEDGQLVTVGGASAREVDPTAIGPGLRSLPERLVLRGSEALPLLISAARADDGRVAFFSAPRRT